MPTDLLELWGGVECTVNRVGDQFFDQMERNGHARRDDDLERFAALGLKTLRYPILWERLAPEHDTVTDWSWADRRLNRLRELGVRPIVGLVHHGSGPRRTNLLDPGFADGLANFARQVAERYPWVEDYTPVNEPLTTARFSALYGHWYPHAHDPGSFARAFLNQCQAVVRAMRAIRAVNPAARLVQTEDLSKTFSTPALAEQAGFENHRRWLTFDLLGGHLNGKHPMWAYLRAAGVAERELEGFLDRPCPPDVLGVNYYVTSERFIDERLDRYPAYARAGSNGRVYADMPAVRASAQGISGPGRLLREAWERYRLPMAVTEAQLNCTREEQMRWFAEIWRDARALREQEGVDVRAVTLWALLGAFNWTNLLTRDDPGSYEPGAFDVRAPLPRPTALADLARTVIRVGESNHPVLDVPGWWRRPGRLAGPAARAHQALTPAVRHRARSRRVPAPLFVTGGENALGHAFGVICGERALPVCSPVHARIDLADPAAVRAALDEQKPWAVIHAADGSGTDPASWTRENVTIPRVLAQICGERGLPFLMFSSGRVFDGRKDIPCDEDRTPDPAEAYGASQAQGEARVLDTLPAALVVRTDVRFGPWGSRDLVRTAWPNRASGGENGLPVGRPFSLAYLPDLVQVCLDLLLDGESGVWHLSNAGSLDRTAFAACAAEITGIAPELSHSPASGTAPARGCALISRRASLLPPWQSALRHLAATPLPA